MERPLSAKQRTEKAKPVRPWQRAEAGRYRSSDERFTLDSEGPSRWFVTDEAEHDELGLARTIGPFPTLDAAKAAADEQRNRKPEPSPLAGRLAEAAAKPRTGSAARQGGGGRRTAATRAEAAPPPPPAKTWLDKLEDEHRDAARSARRLIAALEREGIADAEGLVRRDLNGNQPLVATRLLARAILAAVADTSPSKAIEAVVETITTSGVQRGLPGWEVVERDGPEERGRVIRLTGEDLKAAARAAKAAD